MDPKAILAVGIGAGIGGILRFVVGQLALQRFGPGFPWGTAFINVTGSFLIGVVAQLALSRSFGITPVVRVFAMTGILGGYTTFSTFSLDAIVLIGDGAPLVGALYTLGSVALGLLAAFAGGATARIAAP